MKEFASSLYKPEGSKSTMMLFDDIFITLRAISAKEEESIEDLAPSQGNLSQYCEENNYT